MITKILHGEPAVAHLVAAADAVPGKMVNVGNTPVIANNRAVNGSLAAYAVGGGVYECPANETGGSEPVAGSPCYSNGTTIGNATQGGKHVGTCLAVSGNLCVVHHNPNGTATA